MTCDELIDTLMDYLDGELVEEHHSKVTVHLDGCERCKSYVETYSHTVKVVRKLRCGALPAAVEAKLRAALKDHLGDCAPRPVAAVKE